jgi:hypothetical protein
LGREIRRKKEITIVLKKIKSQHILELLYETFPYILPNEGNLNDLVLRSKGLKVYQLP